MRQAEEEVRRLRLQADPIVLRGRARGGGAPTPPWTMARGARGWRNGAGAPIGLWRTSLRSSLKRARGPCPLGTVCGFTRSAGAGRRRIDDRGGAGGGAPAAKISDAGALGGRGGERGACQNGNNLP